MVYFKTFTIQNVKADHPSRLIGKSAHSTKRSVISKNTSGVENRMKSGSFNKSWGTLDLGD